MSRSSQGKQTGFPPARAEIYLKSQGDEDGSRVLRAQHPASGGSRSNSGGRQVHPNVALRPHWPQGPLRMGVPRAATSTFTQLLSSGRLEAQCRFTSKGTTTDGGAQDGHLDFHAALELWFTPGEIETFLTPTGRSVQSPGKARSRCGVIALHFTANLGGQNYPCVRCKGALFSFAAAQCKAAPEPAGNQKNARGKPSKSLQATFWAWKRRN